MCITYLGRSYEDGKLRQCEIVFKVDGIIKSYKYQLILGHTPRYTQEML